MWQWAQMDFQLWALNLSSCISGEQQLVVAMPTPSRGMFQLHMHQRERLARCLQQFVLKRFTVRHAHQRPTIRATGRYGLSLLPGKPGEEKGKYGFQQKKKMAAISRCASHSIGSFAVFSFFKYRCIISAFETCLVYSAAVRLWQGIRGHLANTEERNQLSALLIE